MLNYFNSTLLNAKPGIYCLEHYCEKVFSPNNIAVGRLSILGSGRHWQQELQLTIVVLLGLHYRYVNTILNLGFCVGLLVIEYKKLI